MTTRVRTIGSIGLQLWLRPDHKKLGLAFPAITTSGYIPPIDTFSSMPQTLWAEDWPAHDRPQTVAYFCGALDVEWPTVDEAEYVDRCHRIAKTEAMNFLDPIVPDDSALIRAWVIEGRSDEEIAHSLRVVQAARTAAEKGVGAFTVDGRMIDAPFIRRAEQILAMARRLRLIAAEERSVQ